MINCTISSATQTKKYGNLTSVTLPASLGQAQILPGHAEAFILLNGGIVILRQSDGQKQSVQISKGGCHVKDNEVMIIL